MIFMPIFLFQLQHGIYAKLLQPTRLEKSRGILAEEAGCWSTPLECIPFCSSGTTGHSFLQPPSYPTLPTPQHTPFCPFIPPPPSPTYSNSSFYLPPSPAYHPSNHHFMFAPPSTPFPPFSPWPQHHPAALVSFGAGRNLDASYMQPSPFHVLEELKPVPGKFIFFCPFSYCFMSARKYY